MSFNRENTVWQSPDGTWNRGFYRVVWVGEDPEWDVEYDDSFEWVSTGHRTEQAAEDSWHGANPGAWTTIPYKRGDTKTCRRLDRMAANLKKNTRK